MQGMASPSTADAVHEAEAAQQAEIAAAVESDAAPVAEAAPSVKPVKLRSKNVDSYPLTVTVVGSKPLVFENDRATVEVVSEVAEQLTYSPVVEVAE